jgi:hypothetical protein
MTAAVRDERDGLWRVVVAVALLLFCGSHRHALQLSGFADDLGLLAELPQRAAQGTLLADVVTKWIGPLWPGSTMWRPLAYSSFALDATLWGPAPGGWRITNLLLHLGVAAFSGLIATRLIGVRLAGAAAFATVLLAPWVPEVTIWLVGRFDGWATLAIVVSLWSALRSRSADRWLALSLIAAIAAYLSKESALILPLWIALMVSAQMATQKPPQRRTALEFALNTLSAQRLLIVSHVVIAGAYLVWRNYLFLGQATSVYASAPEYQIMPLIARLLAHLTFPATLAPLAPAAAAIAAATGAVYVVFAARSGNRFVAIVGVLMALSVVVAVAIHFVAPAANGEGYRLYYLATVGIALIVASAVKTTNKGSVMLLAVFMIALAVWQSRVAAEWTRASHTIDGASRTITAAAATLAPREFGLVLLPDKLGHVPVARNAQGALLTLKDGASPARDFFIIFTPPQLAEWHQLAQQDVVNKLTQRASAPPRITRYFCFNSSAQSLADLGYWSPETLPAWTARWRETVAARCPELAL